jgi:glutathione S-transferase
MRARMALKLANIQVEIREISLRDKPQHMLQISSKGTVPVLQLLDGSVIDESLNIMRYALKSHALGANIHEDFSAIILENDSAFKRALDAYKYPERDKSKTQQEHRVGCEVFLQRLERLLEKTIYLLGDSSGLADIAIFPFVRQFAAVDAAWWEVAPYPKCRAWLKRWVESDLFKGVMEKQPTYTT